MAAEFAPILGGPPLGSVAIAHAHTHTRARAHAHARTRTRMLTLARTFARFCFHVSLFALLLLTQVAYVQCPVFNTWVSK